MEGLRVAVQGPRKADLCLDSTIYLQAAWQTIETPEAPVSLSAKWTK